MEHFQFSPIGRCAAILAAGLAGCTPQTGATPAAAPAAVAGEAVRCIDANRVSGRRVADARSLEFEMTDGTLYRSVTPGACPGLGTGGSTAIIVLESHGPRICAGDSFRAYDPIEARATGPASFPRCRLGEFAPAGRR